MDPQGVESESGELSRTVLALEDRLLRLITNRARGTIVFDDFVTSAGHLLRDLQRCYKGVAELCERRDLGYRVTLALRKIDAHCLWLFRKIRQEQLIFWKFTLETQLRALISEEAFVLHQTLLGADEEEREFLAMDDARVRRFLLGERGGHYG